ncbi:hypothetical protein IFO70_31230 [Phormidium tenue FACHB-886]|nr:hypothetical protein [Phormidium tenue FACHB-886]
MRPMIPASTVFEEAENLSASQILNFSPVRAACKMKALNHLFNRMRNCVYWRSLYIKVT